MARARLRDESTVVKDVAGNITALNRQRFLFFSEFVIPVHSLN